MYYEWIEKNSLENNLIQNIEKAVKSEWNFRIWTKNHSRESEFLFQHRFLNLL